VATESCGTGKEPVWLMPTADRESGERCRHWLLTWEAGEGSDGSGWSALEKVVGENTEVCLGQTYVQTQHLKSGAHSKCLPL
jgi:hypothetical protein